MWGCCSFFPRCHRCDRTYPPDVECGGASGWACVCIPLGFADKASVVVGHCHERDHTPGLFVLVCCGASRRLENGRDGFLRSRGCVRVLRRMRKPWVGLLENFFKRSSEALLGCKRHRGPECVMRFALSSSATYIHESKWFAFFGRGDRCAALCHFATWAWLRRCRTR